MAEPVSATGLGVCLAAPEWIGASRLDSFWNGLWRSEKGRAWSRGGTGLAWWLRGRLSERPFFFCEPWSPALQRRHFSQMWGQVFARSYDNPALSDLYWIHELCHWACADLSRSDSFEEWRLKWDLNELRASCASEILVHGEVEGWDREAFGREAWARRFGALGGVDPTREESWSASSREAAARRLDLREGRAEPMDEDERWFASFKDANLGWASVWSGAWSSVDEGLSAYGEALGAGDEARARAALSKAGAVGAFPAIPYLGQARAFAARG